MNNNNKKIKQDKEKKNTDRDLEKLKYKTKDRMCGATFMGVFWESKFSVSWAMLHSMYH